MMKNKFKIFYKKILTESLLLNNLDKAKIDINKNKYTEQLTNDIITFLDNDNYLLMKDLTANLLCSLFFEYYPEYNNSLFNNLYIEAEIMLIINLRNK